MAAPAYAAYAPTPGSPVPTSAAAGPWGAVAPGLPSAWHAQPRRTSGMAVASLVLGILTIIGGFYLILPSILAVIFGAAGLSQCNNDPNVDGRGMAIAGLVLGVIGLSIVAFFFLVLGAFLSGV